MSKAKMQKMKTYTKMQTGKKVQKKDLPKVISKNLPDWIDSGLIAKTSNGWYMKTNNVDRATSAYKEHLAKNEHPEAQEAPAWVEAAEEAVQGEAPTKEIVRTLWDQARLATGQKAVNIIQLTEGLMSGEMGLNALGALKQEAIGILEDLNLIQHVEGEVDESSV